MPFLAAVAHRTYLDVLAEVQHHADMGLRWGLTLVMLAGGVAFGIGTGVLVRMAAYSSAYGDFPDTLTPGIAAGVGLALILIPLIWRPADRDRRDL